MGVQPQYSLIASGCVVLRVIDVVTTALGGQGNPHLPRKLPVLCHAPNVLSQLERVLQRPDRLLLRWVFEDESHLQVLRALAVHLRLDARVSDPYRPRAKARQLNAELLQRA